MFRKTSPQLSLFEIDNLFQELTLKFADACGTSLKKQRTDSFFIHGWLQILSRYGLFKETVGVFLQNLRKQKPGLYFETYNAEDRPLDVADFKIEIEEENKTITVFSCPTKQAPVDQARSSKTGNILVHFVASVCSRCQLTERCKRYIRHGQEYGYVTATDT